MGISAEAYSSATTRSATMIVRRFVFADGMSGITEASATLNPPTPKPRQAESTTAAACSSAPMAQVPLGSMSGVARRPTCRRIRVEYTPLGQQVTVVFPREPRPPSHPPIPGRGRTGDERRGLARPERGRGPSLPRRGHGATAEGGTPVARGGGGRASRWGGYAVQVVAASLRKKTPEVSPASNS